MNSTQHEVFQEKQHAEHFDARYRLNLAGLKKEYESFNEFQLFIKHKQYIEGKKLLDLGCATGELYRYINHFHKDIEYQGLDISVPAINRAKEKYPDGKFDVIDDGSSVTEEIQKLQIEPDILFCRDVVVHQVRPFDFLKELVYIPKEAVFLRIRTRDKGATVLDPEVSAQYYCGNWAPYMVLNVDELIEAICSSINVQSLHIVRNHMVLGGWHGRYLDKDCYDEHTGTAETAIYIRKSESSISNPDIKITDKKENVIYSGIFSKKPTYLAKAVMNRIFK